MPPTAPIRLITAFARLRRGLGVTSGIRATAGERYTPMATSSSPSVTMNSVSAAGAAVCAKRLSMTGSRFISAAALTVPKRMNGMRRPMRVLVRSDSAPNSGSRKSARILSAAMMRPESDSSR